MISIAANYRKLLFGAAVFAASVGGFSFFHVPAAHAKQAVQGHAIPAEMKEKIEGRLKSILGKEANVDDYMQALKRLEDAAKTLTPKDLHKVMERLKKGVEKAENADKIFDEMIAKLRETQALGDPEGQFVKLMNKAAEAARKRAEAARARGTSMSKKLAEGFEKTAQAFIVARDRAIEARNKTLPAIAFIQQNKADYVDALALREFAAMAAIAQATVAKMEEQSKLIQEAADGMRKGMLGQAEEVSP